MPKKSLGQVFLKDLSWARRIVYALKTSKQGTVVEIGPGRGALTKFIYQRVQQDENFPDRVILIEKDSSLIERLKTFWPDFTVINEDATKVRLIDLGTGPFYVVSNLPYNVSSQILINLLAQREIIDHMVLMFQKEVAQRVLAQGGSRNFGRLAAITQAFFNVKSLGVLSGKAFYPSVAVESQVVIFEKKDPAQWPEDFESLQHFLAGLFSHPRRTILNSLSMGLKVDKKVINKLLTSAGIDPKKRPSQLTLQQVLKLYKTFRITTQELQ